jgi:rubrerythrin
MADDDEAAIHRRNIERYRYLLDNLRDPEMRKYLAKLLREAEEHLRELKSRLMILGGH